LFSGGPSAIDAETLPKGFLRHFHRSIYFGLPAIKEA
jgi:hypothetical protein